MEATPTLMMVLTTVLGVIGTIITAVIAAIKILWNKMEECDKEHAKCREEVASLKAQNRDQERRISEHHDEIQFLKQDASEVKDTAIVAATVTKRLDEKVEALTESITQGDSKVIKPVK